MWQKIWTWFIEKVYAIVRILDLSSPYRVVISIIDIVIVCSLIYYVYKLIKKTRASKIFKGIIFLCILYIVAKLLNMVILKFILENFVTYGILLLIVIFQPELRNVFEKIGRSKIVDVFELDDNIIWKQSVSEIVNAVEIMSLKQIGALIVIERNTKVSEVLKEGVNLSAKVSSELLQNIFIPKTPLHDGAVIIENSQILAAKCVLPLASEVAVPKCLGTRHRAAVGITEVSDAIVVVVSEETGIISVAEAGQLTRNLTGDTLKALLLEKLDKSKNSEALKTIVKK